MVFPTIGFKWITYAILQINSTQNIHVSNLLYECLNTYLPCLQFVSKQLSGDDTQAYLKFDIERSYHAMAPTPRSGIIMWELGHIHINESRFPLVNYSAPQPLRLFLHGLVTTDILCAYLVAMFTSWTNLEANCEHCDFHLKGSYHFLCMEAPTETRNTFDL